MGDPEQRIADDVRDLTATMAETFTGFVKPVFEIMLWGRGLYTLLGSVNLGIVLSYGVLGMGFLKVQCLPAVIASLSAVPSLYVCPQL